MRFTEQETIAMEKIVYCSSPKRRATAPHAGSHGEAPGLVRGGGSKGESGQTRAFVVVLLGQDGWGRESRLSWFRTG